MRSLLSAIHFFLPPSSSINSSAKENGEVTAASVLKDLVNQYPGITDQVQHFQGHFNKIIEDAKDLKRELVENNIDPTVVHDYLTREAANIVETLRKEFDKPLPDELVERARYRNQMISKALDCLEDAFVFICVQSGHLSEQDARRIFAPVKRAIQDGLSIVGDFVDKHPELTEVISAVCFLVPQSSILHLILFVFGFSPASPLKGILSSIVFGTYFIDADYAISRFFGRLDPKQTLGSPLPVPAARYWLTLKHSESTLIAATNPKFALNAIAICKSSPPATPAASPFSARAPVPVPEAALDVVSAKWSRSLSFKAIHIAKVKGEAIAASVLKDVANQHPDLADQVQNFQGHFSKIVEYAEGMKRELVKLNIDPTLVHDYISREAANIVENLKAEFNKPLPDELVERARYRNQMIAKALDHLEYAFVYICVQSGHLSEEDARRIFAPVKKAIQDGLFHRDFVDKHPELTEVIVISAVCFLIPESFILRPILFVFGFGPAGPLKGSLAAWFQSRFWGGAVAKSSWFAYFQRAAMKVVVKI
ncbi:hypothetical protein H1R20_g6233, partial [Candolleomyces eurysporus]